MEKIKQNIYSGITNDWQTCCAIAKRTGTYPLICRKVLGMLVDEKKIESNIFMKRMKYRKLTTGVEVSTGVQDDNKV